MSEYQYYEFQALDRPLSAEDKAYVQSLSSRVQLSATRAAFVYNYGDFRGKPLELLDRCFDMMVYVASFGVRCWMVRFPRALVSADVFQPYCDHNSIKIHTTAKSIILEASLCCESYYTWVKESSWLDALIPLRDDVIRGDMRSLYLLWLQSGFSEDVGQDPDDRIEPPVPPNLKKLTPALQALADLFTIDSDLMAAAAEASPEQVAIAEPIEDGIRSLSEEERIAYLVRVAQGDPQVGADLMIQLRKSFGQQKPVQSQPGERSFADLLEMAEQQQRQRQHREKIAARKARRKQMEALAPKADAIWEEVLRLIALKQSKPYDEAIAHLAKLRDLAEFQGHPESFQSKVRYLYQTYSSRPGLISRLNKATMKL